jgi:hypothetical protein
MGQKTKVNIPGGSQLVISDGGPGVFNLNGIKMGKGNAPAAKHTVVPPNAAASYQSMSDDVSPWGDDNLYPQNVISDVHGSPFAARLLKARIDAHYGKGLFTYNLDIEDGKRTIKLIEDDDFEAFSKTNYLDRMYKQIISDYEWLRNPFVEIILTKDSYTKRKKIARMYRLKTANCRWSKKKNGRSKYLYYSANWPTPQSDMVKAIPALDVEDPFGDLMSRKSGYKFALAYRLDDLDTDYYDRILWDNIRGGWLDIAKNVPKLKMAIMRNSIMLKYIIYIPFSYWRGKYPEWDEFDEKRQEELIDNKIDEINKYLTDVDNYGKSLTTHYDTDEEGRDLGKIEIKPLEQPIKDTMYLPDSQAANEELSSALGVDPAFVGAGLPGGKRSEGSGANKRESYTIHQALAAADRDATLYFIRFVARVNQWDRKTKIGYLNNDISDTLDKNPTGQKTGE